MLYTIDNDLTTYIALYIRMYIHIKLPIHTSINRYLLSVKTSKLINCLVMAYFIQRTGLGKIAHNTVTPILESSHPFH